VANASPPQPSWDPGGSQIDSRYKPGTFGKLFGQQDPQHGDVATFGRLQFQVVPGSSDLKICLDIPRMGM